MHARECRWLTEGLLVMLVMPVMPVMLILLSGCSGPRPLPGDNAATLASLAGRLVSVTPDDGPPRDDARAAAIYRALLVAAPAASPHRGPAQRRLADLEMELAEQRAADGAAPDYRAAITHYEAWLTGHPGAEGRDGVLYQLARAQEQSGDMTLALSTLDRLVAAHPNSPHRDEAEFRRGEMLFAARRWAEAEAAYATVLQAGAGNPWLDRALYMQGWSRYRQGRWDDALRSLFSVLDLRLGGAEPLSRADQELVDDSLRVAALSLEQLQGAAALAPHLQGERRRGYAWRVFDQLAQLYQRQGRARDATDVWQRFAQAQPLAPQAALARQQVVLIHESAGFGALALQARREYAQAHAPDGAWAQAQTAVDGQAAAWWREHVDALARHHHALAQQQRSQADVDAAQAWYRLALQHIDDERRGQRAYLLTALLFDAGRFEAAAAASDSAAYGSAEHGQRADAAYTGLLARGRWIEQTEVPHRAPLQRQQVAAAQRFAQTFSGDGRGAAVLAAAAELQWGLNDGAAAAALARQALAIVDAANVANVATAADAADATARARRQAHGVLGDVAFAAGDAAGAERAYARVLALLPLQDDAAKARYEERLATAIYRQGEAERGAGRAGDAARHFARAAAQAPGSVAAPVALYDSALQLMAVHDWAGATAALQALRRLHPQHRLAASVAPQLALAHAESGRPREAALELEQWAANATDATDADAVRHARWQAATLFDSAGDLPRAAALWLRVQADADHALPQVLQSRWRLAELARAAGKPRDEERWLRALLGAEGQRDSARTEATRTLAAKALLRLAAPLLAAYRQQALTQPLNATLARKKARFDAVLAAYAQAAASGSAEAQTLATAESAALYQDFGRALLVSQRPRGLNKADSLAYQQALEEQARAFDHKAAELLRLNATRQPGGPAETASRQATAPVEPRR